ncbi:hypothetical protein B0T10DRAFT_456137 [Thelonectria olida]|uniref:Uncharacterized protein n=1 Tax=Thelonectria olida TaxID=1576542 RepID=A0A9P8WD42_9HYPO|nr:hypothetical protein B0T10DRAFT_456137 [Thelonectria olida]
MALPVCLGSLQLATSWQTEQHEDEPTLGEQKFSRLNLERTPPPPYSTSIFVYLHQSTMENHIPRPHLTSPHQGEPTMLYSDHIMEDQRTVGMITYQQIVERDAFLREHQWWLDRIMTRCDQDAFEATVRKYITRDTTRILPAAYKDKLYFWFERRSDVEGMCWCQQADEHTAVVE